MIGGRLRGFLAVAGIVALGWWIHEKRPTVSGIIDDLTRPIFGSHAAITESERTRIVGEASHVIAVGEERPIGALSEGMSDEEVKSLMGPPDVIEHVEDERGDRIRWVYRGVNRVILLRNHRVVSITTR
jgi:hypothetical protein